MKNGENLTTLSRNILPQFFIKNRQEMNYKKVKQFVFFLLTIVKVSDIKNKNEQKNIIIHFIYETARAVILVDISSSYTDEIHKNENLYQCKSLASV